MLLVLFFSPPAQTLFLDQTDRQADHIRRTFLHIWILQYEILPLSHLVARSGVRDSTYRNGGTFPSALEITRLSGIAPPVWYRQDDQKYVEASNDREQDPCRTVRPSPLSSTLGGVVQWS